MARTEVTPLLGAAAPTGYPEASAPPSVEVGITPAWQLPIIKPGFSEAEGSGAQPSTPAPSAPPVDPDAISGAMSPGMYAGVTGHVNFPAVGIPSNLIVTKPAHLHTKSLATTSLLLGGVVWLVISVLQSKEPSGAGFVGPGLLTAFALLFYLIESCMSDTRKYVATIKSAEGAEEYLHSLLNTAPDLVMNCRCYHHGECCRCAPRPALATCRGLSETRTRVIHERDSNGNTRTRYETYTVEVRILDFSKPAGACRRR